MNGGECGAAGLKKLGDYTDRVCVCGGGGVRERGKERERKGRVAGARTWMWELMKCCVMPRNVHAPLPTSSRTGGTHCGGRPSASNLRPRPGGASVGGGTWDRPELPVRCQKDNRPREDAEREMHISCGAYAALTKSRSDHSSPSPCTSPPWRSLVSCRPSKGCPHTCHQRQTPTHGRGT